MSNDIFYGGNYEPMVVHRKEDGLLMITVPGTEMQVVSREMLVKMVNDYNEQVTRTAIWKGKWEHAEQRCRDIGARLREEQALRQAQVAVATWGVEHP